MALPFSHDQFLDVFGAYNRALWPAVAALWLATAIIVVQLLRRRCRTGPVIALLVAHWAWSGIAYHAAFFSPINPAARLFAGVFVLQAALFIWYGFARHRLTFAFPRGPWGIAAGVLVLCALAYPALGLLTGLAYPRAPLFALPCPTTLLTAGVLLAATPPVPRWVFVIPIGWAFVGGSAAIALGITPDLMLFIAGLTMIGYLLTPHRLPEPALARGTAS